MQPFKAPASTVQSINEITGKFTEQDGLSGFEALTGYLSIIHLSPLRLQVSRWMPMITGDYDWNTPAEKSADENVLQEFYQLIGEHIENHGISLPDSISLNESDPAANKENPLLNNWIMGIMNGILVIDPLLEEIFATEDDDLQEADETLDECLLALQLLASGPEADELLKEIEGNAEETLQIIVEDFYEILDEITEVLYFLQHNYPTEE